MYDSRVIERDRTQSQVSWSWNLFFKYCLGNGHGTSKAYKLWDVQTQMLGLSSSLAVDSRIKTKIWIVSFWCKLTSNGSNLTRFSWTQAFNIVTSKLRTVCYYTLKIIKLKWKRWLKKKFFYVTIYFIFSIDCVRVVQHQTVQSKSMIIQVECSSNDIDTSNFHQLCYPSKCNFK